MKINTVRFIKSAVSPADYPHPELPEFAFIGRSNSGKSSLINMLTGRKNLVLTGAKPGVTKTVNFFLINEHISLADLPGFGYAKQPKKIRDSFSKIIRNYIHANRRTMVIFLLIDIRRDPGEAETDILDTIASSGISAGVILTKCDKISKGKRSRRVREITGLLGIDTESAVLTSIKDGTGRKELLSIISDYSR